MATQKKLRSFHWKFFEKAQIAQLEEFQQKALLENNNGTSGRTVYDVLQDLIADYNKRHPVRFTMMGETELLKRIHAEGFTATRQTLKKFRDMDVLVDKDNNRIWWTDGHNIVYNYEAVVKFLSKRGRRRLQVEKNASSRRGRRK